MAHTPGVFKNNSWGRTRGPKNIVNPNASLPQSVNLDEAGTTASYITENQRYLHLSAVTSQLNDAGGQPAAGTVALKLQVYSHASGQWADAGWSTIANATTSRALTIIPIYGLDQVRVVSSSHANANTRVTLTLACSTF